MKEFLGPSEKRNPIHEGIESYAVACSLSRKRAVDPLELRNFAGQLMISIARACLGCGAKQIGHIKAHLEHDTGFLSADTLGTPEDVVVEGRDGAPAERFRLLINSVVYGLARDMVTKATEESLDSVSTRFGLTREP
jgi:hypothetical protein